MEKHDDELRVVREVSSLRHQVEDLLRRAIVTGRFKPGQHLVERELCEATGVSRPSIREALRKLEAEGLTTIVPHRGTIVTSVTYDDARQIYAVRGLLEGFAAHEFARRGTPDEVRHLKRAVDGLERAARGGSRRRLVEAKSTFYRALFAGAGNRFIETMLSPLLTRMSFLRMTSMAQEERLPRSLAEIRAIYDRIAERDPVGAREAAEKHVRNAAATALPALAPSGAESDGGERAVARD